MTGVPFGGTQNSRATERFAAPLQLHGGDGTQADLGMEEGNSLQGQTSVPLLSLKAGPGLVSMEPGAVLLLASRFLKALSVFRVTGAPRAVGTAASPASAHPQRTAGRSQISLQLRGRCFQSLAASS